MRFKKYLVNALSEKNFTVYSQFMEGVNDILSTYNNNDPYGGTDGWTEEQTRHAE